MKIEMLLLQTILELIDLEPTMKNWNTTISKENPPRFYRLEIIKSMSKALNLSFDPEKFENIISHEKVYDLEVLKNIYAKYKIDVINKIKTDCSFETSDASCLFISLFKYRVRVEHVLQIDAGVLAVSNYSILPIESKRHIDKILRKEMKFIDDVLAYLLNPTALIISKRELMSNYNFPNVNIDEIDIDWM